MKKSPDGFMEVGRSHGKVVVNTPAWLKAGEAYLRRQVGEPCGAFSPGCFVCRCWVAWANLTELLSETTVPKKKT